MAAAPMMSFGLILLSMMTGPFVGNVLNAPPNDLAALLDPQMILVSLGRGATDAELVELLVRRGRGDSTDPGVLRQAATDLGAGDFQTRQRAQATLRSAGSDALPFLAQATQSPDPEVRITARDLARELEGKEREQRQSSTTYAQKLYAIDLLAQRQCVDATGVLKSIAREADVMLAAAAADAVARIEGRDLVVAEPESVLRELRRYVSEDTGFMAALYLGGTHARSTLATYLQSAKERDQNEQTASMMATSVEALASGARVGILKMLNAVGNIRVDGGIVTFADTLGVRRGAAPILIALRGLHDPTRLHDGLMENGWQAVEVGGDTRCSAKGRDVVICSVDERIVIMATGGGDGLAAVKQVLGRRVDAATYPDELWPAVSTVTAGASRAAMAGTLSTAQREEVGKQLLTEIDRCRQRLAANPQNAQGRAVQLAALTMVSELKDSVRYRCWLGKEGRLEAEMVCVDADKAETLKTAVEGFTRSLRAEFEAKKASMPQALGPIAAQLTADDAWRIKVAGEKVTVSTICLPLHFFLGFAM